MENNFKIHHQWMKKALSLAQKAENLEDVPVGAVIVDNYGNLIAQGHNCKKRNNGICTNIRWAIYKYKSSCFNSLRVPGIINWRINI